MNPTRRLAPLPMPQVSRHERTTKRRMERRQRQRVRCSARRFDAGQGALPEPDITSAGYRDWSDEETWK